jgi:hypothetical protein
MKRTPFPVRRRDLQRDNFALIPASLLPFREQWQQLAGELPAGAVLMIVPAGPSKLRTALQALAPALRARGRQITAARVETVVRGA